MRREDCRVGMIVSFGRPNGEKTKAKVIRVNVRTASLVTIESRGVQRTLPVGTKFTCGFSLMTPVDGNGVQNVTPAPVKRAVVAKNHYNGLVVQAMLICYAHLSPENLTGDGELPRNVVAIRKAQLERQLAGLNAAINITNRANFMTESEVHDWLNNELHGWLKGENVQEYSQTV